MGKSFVVVVIVLPQTTSSFALSSDPHFIQSLFLVDLHVFFIPHPILPTWLWPSSISHHSRSVVTFSSRELLRTLGKVLSALAPVITPSPSMCMPLLAMLLVGSLSPGFFQFVAQTTSFFNLWLRAIWCWMEDVWHFLFHHFWGVGWLDLWYLLEMVVHGNQLQCFDGSCGAGCCELFCALFFFVWVVYLDFVLLGV